MPGVALATTRTAPSWTGRRVTLMGLGRHGGGTGAAKYLAQSGAVLTISDAGDAEQLKASLESLSGLPIHAVNTGGHLESDFRAADVVVVNPAVRRDHPCLQVARESGAQLTSEIEIFLQASPAPTIGVTGSNGKSTTATMLAEMLKAAGLRTWLGGNIGGSLLGALPQMSGDDWVVLELSSFQLAHLSDHAPACAMAVITNFAPNHLDWHGSLPEYAAAKRRLLNAPTTLAVVDAHDPTLADWVASRDGASRPSWPLAAVPPLSIPGEHNRRNAACAAAAAEALGVPPTTIRRVLRDFRGLEHRLQFVGEVDGVRFYNDSKSTSPHATMAALRALRGPVWLLAGGTAKGADLRELAAHAAERICGAAVFGRSRQDLAVALQDAKGSDTLHACETLAEAVAWCRSRARPGDSVLLSPACASHDQFADYRERGSAFCELVRSLAPSR
ncbi:MAG: UDP-N-acetylmuramoyl-L-alanine--D-glutamate ligase [Planctomycetota bacterium]|nr:MAG: UDP-N-acetylmuramoyl-L-alanine--D-glutamate ligase [Planctomycetota bacterium]